MPEVAPRPSRAIVAVTLFAAFTVAYNLNPILHELGHVLFCLGTGGVSTGISSHPLSWSLAWVEDGDPAWTVWGGALITKVVALVLFPLGYARRSPRVYPLLLWCAFAFLIDSVYFLVGAATHTGDPASLMEMGASASLLYLCAATWFVLGAGMTVVAGGVFGMHRGGLLSALGQMAGPPALYFIAVLAYQALYNRSELVTWAAFCVAGVACALVGGGLVALLGARFEATGSAPLGARDARRISGLALAVVATQLLLLGPPAA
ncbi:MAG: M50 family metallopeptidase [Alphaproteobacteria bacterium]|nr:M50 family metallopeptidase [Alphaproteobacteria bacterium]